MLQAMNTRRGDGSSPRAELAGTNADMPQPAGNHGTDGRSSAARKIKPVRLQKSA